MIGNGLASGYGMFYQSLLTGFGTSPARIAEVTATE
jgi:hypothetical protein